MVISYQFLNILLNFPSLTPDEQIALKQQQQGKTGPSRKRRGRDDEQETWQPWGQPGSGAPPRSLNASMKLDLSGVNSAEKVGLKHFTLHHIKM